MLTASACISQTSHPLPNKDSTLALPISQLWRAIIWIERGKLCEQEVVMLEKLVDNLEQKVGNRDSIIARHQRNETDYKLMVKYYKDMYANGEEVIKNLDENIRIHQKFIKREKRKKYLYAIAGAAFGFFILK